MKTPLLILALCLLVTVGANGQDVVSTYVFKINAGQAKAIYQDPDYSVDISSLAAPVDSFLYSGKEAIRAPGHYLYIRPSLELLDIHLRSFFPYHLEIRNNDRDLALELVDNTGRARTDAHIRLKDREIPFDENTWTYRRKNWHRDGLLSVAIDRDTFFYELEDEISRPLLLRKIRYWRQSPAGYWLTTPVRWVENSYPVFEKGHRLGRLEFLSRSPGVPEGE